MFRYLRTWKLICFRIVIFQKANPFWFLTVLHLVLDAFRQCHQLFSTLKFSGNKKFFLWQVIFLKKQITIWRGIYFCKEFFFQSKISWNWIISWTTINIFLEQYFYSCNEKSTPIYRTHTELIFRIVIVSYFLWSY